MKRNLQTNGFEVDNDLIRETWHPVYRRNFLQKALARCQDCRRGFYIYNQGVESDVSISLEVFFLSAINYRDYFLKTSGHYLYFQMTIKTNLWVFINSLVRSICCFLLCYDFYHSREIVNLVWSQPLLFCLFYFRLTATMSSCSGASNKCSRSLPTPSGNRWDHQKMYPELKSCFLSQ